MPSEDAKSVKAEENNDEEVGDKKSSASKNVTKATSGNAKPQSKTAKVKKEETEANDSPKPVKAAATSASRSKQAKVKKEENDDSDDDKPIAKRNIKMNQNKESKKKKKTREEVKKKGKPASEQKKREKKVFELPGQKRDPPEEKDPLRIFYETLFRQVPNSEMAQIWMMESGLLSEKLAKEVYEKKQKKGLQNKFSSPVKSASAVNSNSRSVTVKKKTSLTPVRSANKKTDSTQNQSKKRKLKDDSDSDSDDDFILAKAKKRKVA